ncbi:ABC transporter permease, partial [Streptomyces corynorhini]
MAALTPTAPAAPGQAPRRAPGGAAVRGRRRPRVWRGGVLTLAGLYFVVPLLSSFVFTVHIPNQGVSFAAYTGILSADGFVQSLLLSLGLAAATIALALLLAVPALVAVRRAAGR